MTIQPEGNATATIYNERNEVFRTFQGAPTAENPLTLLAPSDPTNYDVRGGTPCFCESYRYDGDGNLIESVDADDNDLSTANNDPTLGPGDRTLYTYDGFDRRTSVIDPVGNQTVISVRPGWQHHPRQRIRPDRRRQPDLERSAHPGDARLFARRHPDGEPGR